MGSRPDKPFEDDCQAAIGSLRASIIELCDDLGADIETPQEIARKLGVNKTLTWSVSRVVRAATHLEALPHVPGTAAIEQFLRAAATQGASRSRIESVRATANELQLLVQKHFGDRGTLDLMLDGLGSESGSENLQNSRKLAFRGNSGLYGVQARTRMMTALVAPNPEDPDRLDLCIISGYIGFRRLRGNVRWPLFKARSWGRSEDQPLVRGEPEPVDTSRGPNPCSWLYKYCSPGILHVDEELPDTGGRDFFLGEGPVGNHGALDCFRAEIQRSVVYRYAQPDKEDEVGDLGVNVTTPAEELLLDILYHQDLSFVKKANLIVFGRIFGHGEDSPSPTDAARLPIHATPIELVGSPPTISTPMVPRYSELVRDVADACRFDLSTFRGIRVTLDYPPLGASLMLRFPLPPAPQRD
jgi:hypothetical protein